MSVDTQLLLSGVTLLIAVVVLIAAILFSEWSKLWWSLGLAGLVGVGYYARKDEIRQHWEEETKKQQAQDAADAQPRLINEIDGCKVYAFKSTGRWHYFTKCPASRVSTESSWRCGYKGRKTCTEVIDTTSR